VSVAGAFDERLGFICKFIALLDFFIKFEKPGDPETRL